MKITVVSLKHTLRTYLGSQEKKLVSTIQLDSGKEKKNKKSLYSKEFNFAQRSLTFVLVPREVISKPLECPT